LRFRIIPNYVIIIIKIEKVGICDDK
jgi:hypothetical protein